MPYNFNPNFNKHMNQPKDNYKNIKRKGDENPYSNPDVRAMNTNYNNYKSPKLINFLNNDNFEEDVKMYKLEDLDHPNGWNFSELDMLGEMNFRIDDDYKMYSEIEVPSLQLENGSKILAASTSASAVRGMSFNIIFLDEFAFVPSNIAEQFFSSVYPTISSGKSTKVIIISTPHGMNMFYKLWHDAERGKNEYVNTEVHWSEVPGRDAAWKEQTIKNTSEQQFRVEFECEFLGSVDTLISASKLRLMVYEDPVVSNAGLDVYQHSIEDRQYMITVDVSRGLSNDYSAFTVIDITDIPYRVVAKYKNNEIKPILFPSIIHKTALNYNKA